MNLYEILYKLELATLELEFCIDRAREALVDTKHVVRLEDYKASVGKQKAFIEELKKSYDSNNEDEAFRLAKLIEGLSEMVREDSLKLLKELKNE